MRLVATIGALRSGTSAIAQVLHTLGVPVAVSILAPIPPTYRPDWEDADLALKLNPLLAGHQIRDLRPWLAQHIKDRARAAEALFGSDVHAHKSPLLTLVWEDFLAAAGEAPIVITSDREASAVERSVRRAFRGPDIERALATNERIAAALPGIPAALTVSYEALVGSPGEWVRAIAETVGVDDEERINEAWFTVKEPTS